MPPKKSADPPPQSDESSSDFEDDTVRKQQKTAKKAPIQKKGNVQKERTPEDPEEVLKKATDTLFDGSDGEDDNTDLFALRIPPKPDFLVKPNKKDRLMIMNVEVDNFKSYFGKASIGPFHKSFTSIIGPNGSGKSNLIDSLLFVFGFRATKIRSAKVSNLIHKSAGHSPEYCTVTIHFQRIIDAHGHYEIVKNSSFEISRSAFKNGSSSYAIDGRAASKTEVEARLRLVDIDIEHNRFLILQGEVEQIAMMKPVKQTKSETGMVEYLEDIVGSNRLEPFVKRFQRRVNRLHCEQTQQRISRDHARNSKVAMEPQVKASIEYLVKENEATTIQMKLDQRKKQKYLDKVAPKQAELDKKNEDFKLITEKIDSNKKENSGLEEEEKKLSKESSNVDRKIDQVTKEMSDLEAEEKRRKETIKRHETDISKTQSELEKEEKKKQNLIAVPEKAEKKIQKYKEEQEQLLEIEKTANDKADENEGQFDREKEKYNDELKTAQKSCTESVKRNDDALSAATVAEEELKDIMEKADSGKKKLDDLKKQLKSLEDKNTDNKRSLEELRAEKENLTKREAEISSDLPVLREDYRKINIQVNTSQDQLFSIKQRNTANNRGESKLFRRLREEREAGRIKSYIGRLGDHAIIDPKYEAAVCTNFGYHLNLLVVGRSEDAVKIIDLCRKETLGRVNTVSLDKLRRCNQSDLQKPQQGSFPGPRIVDLIDCDPEMRHVMFDQFKNTIVADSRQLALQWNKTYRGGNIVTLQGDLIATNGNVTGGGKPLRGMIFTDKSKQPKKVTQEDLATQKKLEEEVEKMKQESNDMKQKLRSFDGELTQIRHKLTAVQKRLDDLSPTVSTDVNEIVNLKKLVETQEEEAKKVIVDPKDIENRKKIVEDRRKEQKEYSAKAEESRKRQAEIQSKIDELYRELLGCHKDEARDALNKRQKLEKDMAKEQASVTNSARNIAKCDENIARLQRDIEKKRRLCDELQEKAVDEDTLTAKKESLEELTKKKADIVAQQTAVSDKMRDLVESDGKLDTEKKAIETEINDLMESLEADKQKVKELDRKLKGLQLNRIPRFQFLAESSKPEDLTLALDDMPSDDNESPEDTEKNKKQMASNLGDRAYAMEYGLRRKGLENTEAYDNVDGDMVPVVLLTTEQVAEITNADAEQLQFALKNCESQLSALKPKVDLTIIGAYVKKVIQFNEQVMKLAEVNENHRRHNEKLQQLKRDRLDEFHSAFEFIGKHLVAVYKMLTDGGDAKLEYIDKDDPFKEGISFMVRPAKKAWKQIQFLSGGEKTLSSLALIFALHMFRPTPFYVMDEIDAALDYRNVSIIAQYVRQKTENAQFIIISLRNNMFELANRLVGIYKVNGCTKNVAIDPERVCEMAKIVSESLGQVTCTLPAEVTQRFNETMSRNRQRMTANEKQYPNFPSTNDISKAEKIVNVEGRVRKEMNQTDQPTPGPSRPTSTATTHNATNRSASARPESRVNQLKVPNPRLVERSSTVVSRTPRKDRNTTPDETTPPVKRSTSAVNGSPKKAVNSSRKNMTNGDEEQADSE